MLYHIYNRTHLGQTLVTGDGVQHSGYPQMEVVLSSMVEIFLGLGMVVIIKDMVMVM